MRTRDGFVRGRAVALVLAVTSPAWAGDGWVRQSPMPYPPGGFQGVERVTPFHVLAVTAGTGGFNDALFESFDGGDTWDRRELNIGSDPSYRNIWFFDESVGFINGNGSGSNLRTTDGGQTWQPLSNNVAPYTWYGTFLVDGQFGWMHGNGTPAFTQNGGVSWYYPELEGDPNEPYFAFQRVGGFSSDFGVGLGAGDLGIWRTTDQGHFWELVYEDPNVGAITMFDDQVAVAFRGSTALRSTNAGQSWTSVSLPASGSWVPHAFDATRAIAVHYDGSMIRTADAGATWQTVNSPLGSSFTGFEVLGPGVAVASQLSGGNTHILFRTTDYGQTWTPVGPNPSVTVWSLDFYDSQYGFAVGGDNTRLRTNDGGLTWDKLNTGTMNYVDDVLMLDPLNGLAVGENWILRTTDGGNRWEYDEFIAYELFDIDRLPSGKLVAGGSLGYFRTSTDGGATWATSTPIFDDITRLHFVNDQEGWLTTGMGSYGKILHTTNGGQSWTLQFGPILATYYGLDFGTSEIGIAGGTFEGYHRTTDGGQTWTYHDNTGGNDVYAVEFVDEDTVFIGGSFGYLARSDNAGLTWQLLNSGTDHAITAIDAVDENTVWAVATADVTLFTTDGGASWTVENPGNDTPLFNAFLGVDALPTGEVWAVGEFGAIFKRESTAIVATLEDVAVTFGTHVSGGLPQLTESDDAYYRTRSRPGFTAFEPNRADVRFGLDMPGDPATLHAAIESRLNNPSGTAKIGFRDWAAGAVDFVATYALTTNDATETIPGVPAAEYRRDDGRVEMTAKHVVIATFSAIGFDSYFDRVALEGR